MSRLRWRRVLKSVNPDIANLIDENTLGEAAHNMFSGALERKMKERAESIKLLSASKCSCPYKLITTSVLSGRLTHCPPLRGGGQANRGRFWQKLAKK